MVLFGALLSDTDVEALVLYFAAIKTCLYAGVVFLDPLPFFVNLDPGLYRDPLFLGLILFPVIGYSLVCRRLLQEQPGINILKLRKETRRVMQPGPLACLEGVLF